MALLAWNVERNRDHFSAGTILEVAPLRWGEPVQCEPPFDWIIASDITYDDEAHAALCVTLRELLSLSRTNVSRAVLCEEHGPPSPFAGSQVLYRDDAFEAFVATAMAHGLTVTPFDSESGLPIAERAWPMDAFCAPDLFLAEVSLAPFERPV
jgi:hypothetical protein